MMSLSIDSFFETMLSFFPSVKNEYEKHMEEYRERLDTVVVEDIFMPEVLRVLDNDWNKELLEKLFTYFEEVVRSDNEELVNILSITVLEILGNDRGILRKARKYMKPQTYKLQIEADKDLGRGVFDSNNIKAIITDLDRTLLRTDKSLSEYTVSVLKKCKERGIKVMAATARPERAVTEFDAAIGFDAMTVMNGAKVMVGDKVMTYGIPDELAEEMLAKVCERKEFLFSVETGEILYAGEHIAEFEYTLHTGFPKLPAGETAYKILVSGEGAAEFVKENLPDGLHCTVANGYLVQIMSKDANKRNGVQVMLDAFGIAPSEAVYLGDDQDDAESMQFCGLGVAVENAIPEVKAVVDDIAESNDADGVARWIEKHLL